MWNFVVFARRKITDPDLLLFFPRGDRIDPVVLECNEWAGLNRNEKL